MNTQEKRVKNNGLSLDEWIEAEGLYNLQKDIRIHIEMSAGATEEDIDPTTRCVMISIRQAMEKKANG